jgi:hypothetical protein
MKNLTIFFAMLAMGICITHGQTGKREQFSSGFEKVSGSGAIAFERSPGSDKAHQVTFIVDMTGAVAEGGVVFNPEIHQVYISGTFTGWAMPGSNTNFQMQVVTDKQNELLFPGPSKNKEETLLYSLTLQLDEGTHYYKYFLVHNQPTWSMGEWPGDPNREVIISGPATINNVWGTTASFAGGNGSPENPYQVATADHLDQVRHYSFSHFIQIADIDLGEAPWNEGEGWNPIGNEYMPFYGAFDGNGFSISNLTINKPNNGFLGLFGFLIEGYIKDVNIENASIVGVHRVGVLCGLAYFSYLENCFTSGEIFLTSNWAGGLTGAVIQTQISNSYSIANIQANGFSIGGLTGTIEDHSMIINSYATGNTTGSRYVGGLAGWAEYYSQVINSYAVGMVTGTLNTGGLVGDGYDLSASNSYWNVETTGQNSSLQGSPKTTAELIQQSTYTNWDFSGTWSIIPGETYAFLQMQGEPGSFNYPPAILPPSAFAAVPGDHHVALSWVAPSLGNPDAILIYRNDELYQTMDTETTSFLDDELENFIYYSYYLTARFGESESNPTQVITTFANPGFSGGDGSFENPSW